MPCHLTTHIAYAYSGKKFICYGYNINKKGINAKLKSAIVKYPLVFTYISTCPAISYEANSADRSDVLLHFLNVISEKLKERKYGQTIIYDTNLLVATS